MELETVLQEVVEWGNETFPNANSAGIVAHLRKEVEELERDPGDAEEMADVLILLSHLAAKNHVNLREAVSSKLAVLRTRTWGEPDENGVIEHVRES